ncbi:MAG: hypothetical protein JO222_01595, partial [Frankiales bacterium]|nr:hypothetical protein [Frankiales bacterium]
MLVTATGCIWGSEGGITLTEGSTADPYPSVVNVPSGTGTFDYNGEGNILDGLMTVVCSVQPGSSGLLNGDSVDIVLQGPQGGTVTLASGLTSDVPVDIIAIDPSLFSAVIGAGPASVRPAVAHRSRVLYAPAAKRKVVLRRVAKLFYKRYGAHAQASTTAKRAVSIPDECEGSNNLAIVSTQQSTSLPLPAPPAPYGNDLSSFIGTNPRGDWKLWVNSTSTDPVLELSAPRPNILSPTDGGIGGWALVMASHVGGAFVDQGAFTVTGDDTAASPLTLTMHVKHDAGLVTPTGQVDFIECTSPLCDGNTVGIAPLVPDGIGS